MGINNNTHWQKIKTNVGAMVVQHGLMTDTEIAEKMRTMAEQRRHAKEKLDQEIFNHYFLEFSGNG